MEGEREGDRGEEDNKYDDLESTPALQTIGQ
jgi:hypothetical protein